MHAIQSALSQKAISLGNIQKEMQAEGHSHSPVAASSLQFAEDASDQLLDMGFWHDNTGGGRLCPHLTDY